METKVIDIQKPEDVNIIVGQAHFIKTVEDLYEILFSSMPSLKFGIAFCEASGECLVRVDGTDDELKQIAANNALNVGCGHSFFVVIKDAYPINVLNQIKGAQEVCRIFCATANPLQVIVSSTEQGRGIMGVIDGSCPRGIEEQEGLKWRTDLLRQIGYKR